MKNVETMCEKCDRELEANTQMCSDDGSMVPRTEEKTTESHTVLEKYKVRYYIGDYIVGEGEETACFKTAVDEALGFSCAAFDEVYEAGEDDDGYIDSYVEVVRCSDLTKMFWANEDGDRGSDYDGDDVYINRILDDEM